MKEEIFRHSLIALFFVSSFLLLVHAQNDESEFISIACGLPISIGSFKELTTGLTFVSDDPFIKTGVIQKVSSESENNYLQQLLRLRAFPEGTRNCYTIQVSKGTRYLIRTRFYYGNYDGKSNSPSFDVHLGANYWDTVTFLIDSPIYKEILHVAVQNYVRVCVVNVGKGTPLISAIELRPLTDEIYVTQSGSLSLQTRVDLGSTSNVTYRYPQDVFDRSWYYMDINNILFKANWSTVSTSNIVNPDLIYKIPTGIMSTAIAPGNSDEPLTYSWYTFNNNNAYYVYLHFAEIEELKPNESRSFDILVNGKLLYESFVPNPLKVTTLPSLSPLPQVVTQTFGNYTISMVKRENSTQPPILNAIETYLLLDLSQLDTDQDDVEAITMIKSTYTVKRNWDGDPCAPVLYTWTGLTCSFDDSPNPPRITALNLSSSGLIGEITSNIFNLSKLQSLDLSNNGLTGPIPQFLAQLPNLKTLHLENNNFTGSIPVELVEKSKNGSLALSVDDIATTGGENINQCSLDQCNRRKKKKTVLVPVLSSVGGLLLILLAAAAILLGLKKRKKPVVMPPTVARVATESEVRNGLQRRYTFLEVQKMTDEFKNELGRGGFGTVYLGIVGKTQVAVKKLSASSAQGYREFLAEVKLLMTVHHINLTSLVGYCIEGTNMALIYEYMTNGDLYSNLLGDRSAFVLSWEQRLKIALDSAHGLEYLHNGCKPPIVHRDIKTTNILLTENFQGKLADFGLSRSFPTDDASHMFTGAAGTPGYLDPEYVTTGRLTEKSDVYSFGVVLLQLITRRTVMLIRGNERTHLSQWVSSMLSNGDINGIVDQRLMGNFDTSSVWKAVEIAIVCVSKHSIRRPGMSNVVSELKECLEIESLARRSHTHMTDPTNSTELFSVKMPSEINPVVR